MSSRFLFKKGTIEVINYLYRGGKANYYEIYKQYFVGSRQTISNILKTLETEGVVTRKIIENRPPRVEYSLTGKGRKIAETLEKLEEILTRSS